MAMKKNENEEKKSFEAALFLALKKHGLLFPIGTEKANESESGIDAIESQLPVALNDPQKFTPKRGKIISFDPKLVSKHRKVASRTGAKRKKKK